jgi:hypothetical protein
MILLFILIVAWNPKDYLLAYSGDYEKEKNEKYKSKDVGCIRVFGFKDRL